jgi:CheY-like chemotaxis protein
VCGAAADRLQQVVWNLIANSVKFTPKGGTVISLIQRVRALPANKGGRTRAIALTAFARAEDVQRALDAGYQMHVAKPVGMAQLARAIADIVRGPPNG